MIVYGSATGQESKRVEVLFYRGIVIDNNDPYKLNRVRIYIPELSNQPFDDWIGEFDTFILKAVGENANPKKDSEKKTTGDWEQIKLLEDIIANTPWAEPCYPIMGESGSYKYYSDGELSTISDCNYEEGFQSIDKDPPTLEKGSFSPAFIYELKETAVGDFFNDPLKNFSVKNNPYAFSYRPDKFVNKTKGFFGIPNVGAKVWVFHHQGLENKPVYFGTYVDYRELALVNDTDNEEQISAKYPTDFES